jgi:CheY-like chemotaxis protein
MPDDGSCGGAPGDVDAGGYILLVDDEEAILEVLVAFLRDEEGYTVYAARSGVEALSITPADPPVLVLMDITLRNEDARDVARRIRERPGWEGVPLVLCTAAPHIHEIAQDVGAAGTLAKPFDLVDLLHIVQRYGLERQQPGPA